MGGASLGVAVVMGVMNEVVKAVVLAEEVTLELMILVFLPTPAGGCGFTKNTGKLVVFVKLDHAAAISSLAATWASDDQLLTNFKKTQRRYKDGRENNGNLHFRCIESCECIETRRDTRPTTRKW